MKQSTHLYLLRAPTTEKLGPELTKSNEISNLGEVNLYGTLQPKPGRAGKRQKEELERRMWGSKVHTGKENIWTKLVVWVDSREVSKAALCEALSSRLSACFSSPALLWPRSPTPWGFCEHPGSQFSSSGEAANLPLSPDFNMYIWIPRYMPILTPLSLHNSACQHEEQPLND